MKAVVKVVAGCAVGTMLLTGCGNGSSSSTGGGAAEQGTAPSVTPPKASTPQKQPLKVKGLYLGMDLTEAQTICKQLLEGSGCSVEEIQDGQLAIFDIGESGGKFFGFTALGMRMAGGGVTADVAGKVNGFTFSGGLVRHIFKASEMEDSDFVQKFADSYKIPEFNVSDDMKFWYFDSPDGYRIKIKKGKDLTVKQIAGSAEQKFD